MDGNLAKKRPLAAFARKKPPLGGSDPATAPYALRPRGGLGGSTRLIQLYESTVKEAFAPPAHAPSLTPGECTIQSLLTHAEA
jgi:hypothetical protein